MSSVFHLQSKLAVGNDSIVSIINPYVDGVFPYWISNPTGAKITKIKAMAGEVVAGIEGGSIVVKLYRQEANPISGDTIVSETGIPVSYIEDNWEYITEIDYSATNVDLQYGVDYRLTDVNLTTPSFVIGVVSVVGDIKIENLFVWVEYENNPL